MLHVHQFPSDVSVSIEGTDLVGERLEVGALCMVDQHERSTLVALVQPLGDDLPRLLLTFGRLGVCQARSARQLTRPNVTVALEHAVEEFPTEFQRFDPIMTLIKGLHRKTTQKNIVPNLTCGEFLNNAPHPMI